MPLGAGVLWDCTGLVFWSFKLFSGHFMHMAKVWSEVGPGIDLPHIPSPSQEEIDHWHQAGIEAGWHCFQYRMASQTCLNREEVSYSD